MNHAKWRLLNRFSPPFVQTQHQLWWCVRRWQPSELLPPPPTALGSTRAGGTPSWEFTGDALLSCCRKRKSPPGESKRAVVGLLPPPAQSFVLNKEPRVFFCLSDAFKCRASLQGVLLPPSPAMWRFFVLFFSLLIFFSFLETKRRTSQLRPCGKSD